MKTLEQIKACGARACAYRMYKDGQGLESNPYKYGSEAYQQFESEMERLMHLEQLQEWGMV